MSEQAAMAKQRGNAYFVKGQWNEAEKEFSDAIKLDASQHVFFSNRSACYLELNNPQMALSDAEECIRLRPDWAKGYSRKAHALFRMGRFSESTETYTEGLKTDPQNASLREGLAMAQRRLAAADSPADSQNMFSNVRQRLAASPEGSELLKDADLSAKLSLLEADPKGNLPAMIGDPKVMQAMGVLLKGMGVNVDLKNAAQDQTPPQPEKPAEEAETPQSLSEAEQLRLKGNEAYKKRQFEEAAGFYSEAARLDPKNISAVTNRAAVRMMQGDLAAARADCETALKTGRREFSPFKQVAKALERLGDIERREENLPAAAEDYRQSLLECANYAVKKKLREVDALLAARERREYLDPAKAMEHKEKGNALFRESRFQDALKEYSESLKRNPEDAKVYCNRAAVYSKLVAWEYALQDCEKSIELDPSFAKAYLRKGKIQHLLKDYAQAVLTFNAGLKIELNSTQLTQAKQETMLEVMRLSREGKFDKEQKAKAMADPEIQGIMNDPVVREALEQMKTPSPAGNSAFSNPEIMEKLEVLMAAGIVQMG